MQAVEYAGEQRSAPSTPATPSVALDGIAPAYSGTTTPTAPAAPAVDDASRARAPSYAAAPTYPSAEADARARAPSYTGAPTAQMAALSVGGGAAAAAAPYSGHGGAAEKPAVPELPTEKSGWLEEKGTFSWSKMWVKCRMEKLFCYKGTQVRRLLCRAGGGD